MRENWRTRCISVRMTITTNTRSIITFTRGITRGKMMVSPAGAPSRMEFQAGSYTSITPRRPAESPRDTRRCTKATT